MANFPALTPSARPLTPGLFGGVTHRAMDGSTSGIRRSSAEIGRTLPLRFENVSEADFLAIVNHYRGQRSRLDGFAFTTTTIPAAYTPNGHQWLYASAPKIVDRHADVFTVELEVRSEPRGVFRVPGAAFTLQPVLAAPGIVPIVPGLALSRTPALAAGGPTAIVSGAALSMTPALAVGGPTAIISGAALQAGTADPSFASVSLLLHMDGSNGSTTFTDSSNNAFTITASGNAQISTTDPKYGSGALTLDGVGDFLSTPANSAFALGTGDFTVECWAFVNSGNTNNGLFTFGGGLALAVFSGNWALTTTGSGGTTMGAVATGVWQHVAVTRTGSSLRLFINGVQLGSTITNSSNFTDNQLRIGYYFSSSYAINARVDEFRVTKGVSRYQSTFTPATAAFPDSAASGFTPGVPTEIVGGASYASTSPSLTPGAPV